MVQKFRIQIAEIQIAEIQMAEIQMAEIQMAEIQTAEIQILSELGQRWNSLLSQGKVDDFRTTELYQRTNWVSSWKKTQIAHSST